MKHQVISVTEFKAKCLALLDQIGQEGGTLTITKRGRPLATVGPAKSRRFKSSAGILAGKVKIAGDLINTNWEWDRERAKDLREALGIRRK
jgi:prevent-host-death family protein